MQLFQILFFLVVFQNRSPSISDVGKRCSAVWLCTSRNVLWATTLQDE